MNKTHIATIGVFGILAICYSGFLAYEHSQFPKRWKALTPLVTPLVDQGGGTFHTTFEAGHSEPHHLGISFQKVAGDPKVNSDIEKWNDPRHQNATTPPGPDLRWKILRGNKTIASGGNQPITEWIGQSIVVGTFPLKSGAKYDLEINIGPSFRAFLECEPTINVGVDRAAVSVELAIAKDLEVPISIATGAVGAVLSLVAAIGIWANKRTQATIQA